MSEKRLADATLILNNVAVFVVPNSVKFDEGLGEQTIEPQSAGGGVVEGVYSDNVEGKKSSLKFSVMNTTSNIELAKNWKLLQNANAATLSAPGGFSRAFNNMAITNNYEVGLGADTNIDLEMEGDPAV